MAYKLQIGNLETCVGAGGLERLFAPYGAVRNVRVATRSRDGRRTGVGFVEMDSVAAVKAAVAALHGREHLGRVLSVARTREREDERRGRDERDIHESHGSRTHLFGPMYTPGTDDAPRYLANTRGLPTPGERS